ncbi:hypothetical protein H4R33_000081 [Dimargaris cristalligena]|uniref:Short-chain dehydrogenase n=1 Tax=Dimargaris cristalligena TaxID=215637 RepID=A0A4P9ZRQ9_9FUNG|nr:hypothetical protein H4R33_000081 [Dimargaris cristalligena]RKP36097.1 short-chain dehydrogenase [Dimargaris cristalligena]|eukprot:RKP36097.1 short-chain dehydrogenase [Dimargaris cristalligena]
MPNHRPVILVTGASRGIGLAIVQEALKLGSHVVGIARSESRLQEIQTKHEEQIGSKSDNPEAAPQFRYVAGDLNDASTTQRLVDVAIQNFGRITGLVHNAGVIEPIQKIADVDVDAWKALFDVNVFAVVRLTQQAIPHLRKSQGRIVMLGSGASTHAYHGWSSYCCSKAAVHRLAASLTVEEAAITTVTIAPGVVDTDMTRIVREDAESGMSSHEHARFVGLEANKEMVRPEQPGHVIAAVAISGESSLGGKEFKWNDSPLAQYQLPA